MQARENPNVPACLKRLVQHLEYTWNKGLKIRLQKRVRLRQVQVQQEVPDVLNGPPPPAPKPHHPDATAYVAAAVRTKLREVFLLYCRHFSHGHRSSATMSASEFLRFARDAALASGRLQQGDLLDIFESKARTLEAPELSASLRRAGGGAPPSAAEADDDRRLSAGSLHSATPRAAMDGLPAVPASPAASGSASGHHLHLESAILEHSPDTAPGPGQVLVFQDWLALLTAVGLRLRPDDMAQEAFDAVVQQVLPLAGQQEAASRMDAHDVLLPDVLQAAVARWTSSKRTKAIMGQVFHVYAQPERLASREGIKLGHSAAHLQLKGFDGDAVTDGYLSSDNFCTMVVDFEIHPKRIAKTDMLACFGHAKHGIHKPATELDASKPLNYAEFLECLARLAILGFYAPGNPPPMPLVEFKHSEYNPQAKDYWLQHPNGLPASPSVQVVTGRLDGTGTMGRSSRTGLSSRGAATGRSSHFTADSAPPMSLGLRSGSPPVHTLGPYDYAPASPSSMRVLLSPERSSDFPPQVYSAQPMSRPPAGLRNAKIWDADSAGLQDTGDMKHFKNSLRGTSPDVLTVQHAEGASRTGTAESKRPLHLLHYSPDWVGKPATPLNEIGKLTYSRTVTGLHGPTHFTATHKFDYQLMEKQTAKMFDMFKKRMMQEQQQQYEGMVAHVEHRQRCLEAMDIAMWRRRYLESCSQQDKAWDKVVKGNLKKSPLRSISVGRFLDTTMDRLTVAPEQ